MHRRDVFFTLHSLALPSFAVVHLTQFSFACKKMPVGASVLLYPCSDFHHAFSPSMLTVVVCLGTAYASGSLLWVDALAGFVKFVFMGDKLHGCSPG
jgi:hypothetical protein